MAPTFVARLGPRGRSDAAMPGSVTVRGGRRTIFVDTGHDPLGLARLPAEPGGEGVARVDLPPPAQHGDQP